MFRYNMITVCMIGASQVDEVFPVHANPTDFFLQLFSSSFLNEKDGSYFVSILHRLLEVCY